MTRKSGSDNARARFARYLDGHLLAGTRPGQLKGEPWNSSSFAAEVSSSRIDNDAVSPRTIANWRKAQVLPQRIEPILDALFGLVGTKGAHAEQRERLRNAYVAARQEKSSLVVSRAKRDPAGRNWVVRDEQFVLERSPRPTDRKAAADPLRAQLQAAISTTALDLSKQAKRLANSPTWSGLGLAAAQLYGLLQCEARELPNKLGELYALVLSLGQFLETDARVQKDPACVDGPLDASLHGALSNLVRLAAPWIRGFPTIATWDDAAGKALVREDLFQPARDFGRIAKEQKTISESDAAEIDILAEAGDIRNFQGKKAGARAVGDVQNLILSSAEAAAKSMAGNSSLPLHAQRALATLRAGRDQVEKVADNLQPDLRHALLSIVGDAFALQSKLSPKSAKKRTPRISRDVLYRLGKHLESMYGEFNEFNPDFYDEVRKRIEDSRAITLDIELDEKGRPKHFISSRNKHGDKKTD